MPSWANTEHILVNVSSVGESIEHNCDRLHCHGYALSVTKGDTNEIYMKIVTSYLLRRITAGKGECASLKVKPDVSEPFHYQFSDLALNMTCRDSRKVLISTRTKMHKYQYHAAFALN